MVNEKNWKEPSEEERERLYLLIEECSELAIECHGIVQMATKVLRFGYEDVYDFQGSNRTRLQAEIGDVQEVIRMMVNAGDLKAEEILRAQHKKREKLKIYMSRQGTEKK